MRQQVIATLIATIFLAGAGGASADSLDLDSLAHGEIVWKQFLGTDGVTITGSNPTRGFDPHESVIAFDAEYGGTTTDRDLLGPSWSGGGNLAPSKPVGTLLILAENLGGSAIDGIVDDPDDEGARPAGEIHFLFDRNITEFGFDLIDVEGSVEYTGGFFAAFYSGGSLLGKIEFKDLPTLDPSISFGDNSANRIAPISAASLGGTSFDKVVIGLGGSGGVGGPNFVFVPLPVAAWAGLALLGGLAGLRRLRRRK